MRRVSEELFFRSSWVIFFIFICLMIYERNLKYYHSDLENLQFKVASFQNEIAEAQKLNESLKLKVLNQKNFDWVSQVLIEELGVIPQGQKKIILKKHNEHFQ